MHCTVIFDKKTSSSGNVFFFRGKYTDNTRISNYEGSKNLMEPSLDALPLLNEDYVLEEKQIKDFQAKGHAVLRGVASPEEINIYRPILNRLVHELNDQTLPLNERGTYGKAFIQITNLWKKSVEIERFVLARRFAKIAAELMGVEAVRIYHDQALFKEAGGGHTPWHQDQIYWPIDSDKTITMWMPFVSVSEEIGSMTFASGSQTMGLIDRVFISDESHKTLKAYIEAKQFEQVNYGALAAGDATFHSGWTLHSAPGNPTSTMREVMTVIYYADGSVVAEPDTQARQSDLKNWFPGCNPGELAVSPLNPIVYCRD
jgi:ectoine hydroxylase-related dioxygenase (phytanoyl-CoA dioxygenase family)